VEEAKASQAASTSQNKVLDSLTRLRNSGRVSGFHISYTYKGFRVGLRTVVQGQLGSLGTIPDKYDVAVTTACGSLNNMVVDSDTVQHGQTCIEYLRKQNVRRANFLVLEKIDETNGKHAAVHLGTRERPPPIRPHQAKGTTIRSCVLQGIA